MPLLLIDLDNTLVDRAAAFLAWAEAFRQKHVPEDDGAVAWLVEADADGHTPRDDVAKSARNRFRLGPNAHAALVNDLRGGMADHLELDPGIIDALRRARGAGWAVVIVTNGTVEQQQRKLQLSGLDAEVDACVVSEAAGSRSLRRRSSSSRPAALPRRLRGPGWSVTRRAQTSLGPTTCRSAVSGSIGGGRGKRKVSPRP